MPLCLTHRLHGLTAFHSLGEAALLQTYRHVQHNLPLRRQMSVRDEVALALKLEVLLRRVALLGERGLEQRIRERLLLQWFFP